MRYLWSTLLAVSIGSGPALAHDAAQARYLGNEGVMVASGSTKILFDPFYAESFGGRYVIPTDATEQAMRAGTPPFDGVDAIFVTHIHPDHFNSRKMIAYLRAQPNVRLYAGIDVIGAIYAADVGVNDPMAKQLAAIHIAPGKPARKVTVGDLDIEVYPIPHNGNGPIPHYAFRITLDKAATVMHLGDADDADSHYAPYQADFDAKRTDAAFAPTWLLTSESGRRVLEQRIRPVKTIGIHAEEKMRSDPAKTRAELKADVFLEPGETRPIAAGPR